MTAHRLVLRATVRERASLTPADHLWLPDGEPSSFDVSMGAHLEQLGAVPVVNKDLVHLAALVFLADRGTPRGREWDREIELDVPVSDPDRWTSLAGELEDHLHLLTGDWWSLRFEKAKGRRRGQVRDVQPAGVVCLFSGGADSLAGALLAYEETGEPPVLVSHTDFMATTNAQNRLTDLLGERWQGMEHHRIRLAATESREGSRRSRSFMFLALGLAVAAVRGAELRVSENGFTSINPPLSPERRGSLTTRTTHPAFLDGMSATLAAIGITTRVLNPFESLTKGEVLAKVGAKLGAEDSSVILSASHSCGKPTQGIPGVWPGSQCGICFGCLIRRGSFIASGLEDETSYVEKDLGGALRKRFMSAQRRKTLEAVSYRLARGYSADDVLSMGLPERIGADDALRIVRDGLEELRPVEAKIKR